MIVQVNNLCQQLMQFMESDINVKFLEHGMIELWTEVFTLVMAMQTSEYRDDCLYNMLGVVSELCAIPFSFMFVIDASLLL